MVHPISHKFAIKLTDEQRGSFPVSIEHLWFEQKEPFYQLKNIPQFVDEVSYDDLVELKEVGEGEYTIQRVVIPSDNSSLWLLFKDYNYVEELVGRLKLIGCGVEGGTLEGYYSVNVPKQVKIEACYKLIDFFESKGVVVADYPSLRQGD